MKKNSTQQSTRRDLRLVVAPQLASVQGGVVQEKMGTDQYTR
jgi:hypothetical protein